MNKQYKQFGEMSFNSQTPDEVCRLLVALNKSRERVKLRWGNVETGVDWNDEWDTIGTIGRSTGTYKIPLLIRTARSHGGGAVLDDCILKITSVNSGRVLYKHPNYKERKLDIVPSDMVGYKFNTTIDGKIHGRHKSMRDAKLTVNRLS